MLRSKLGGHYSGTGTGLAFTEVDETYCDRKAQVRLPSDWLDDKAVAELSGPVYTYRLPDHNQANRED